MSSEAPSEYRPKSRRPIAAMFRRTADLAVRVCVRLHIHPDAISYGSIGVSAIAAAMFWQSARWPVLLLIAPLFCFARLWLNMLDGMVAIAAGKASRRGEILNDLPDRISDILIFAGVAHSGYCRMPLGYWAALLAVMTAYVGVTGQALTGRREYAGVMSKPWRMVVLTLGGWITFFALLASPSHPRFAQLTILDWACVIIIVGCVQTMWVRLSRTLNSLQI